MLGYSSGREIYPSSPMGLSSVNVQVPGFSVGNSFRLNDDYSVFQVEIFAILKAIEAIAGCPASESYMIFVDSQAAFWAIASVWCKSRLVRECNESLGFMDQTVFIHAGFPCHNGKLGNETVNAFASLASLSEADLLVGPDPPVCYLYGLMNG